MRLENMTSHDPWATDTWEVDYFDEDCSGRKLKEPLLGVRVNGGTWLEVRALLEHIEEKGQQPESYIPGWSDPRSWTKEELWHWYLTGEKPKEQDNANG